MPACHSSWRSKTSEVVELEVSSPLRCNLHGAIVIVCFVGSSRSTCESDRLAGMAFAGRAASGRDCQGLRGRHDFAAFGSAPALRGSTVRTVLGPSGSRLNLAKSGSSKWRQMRSYIGWCADWSLSRWLWRKEDVRQKRVVRALDHGATVKTASRRAWRLRTD